MCNILQVADNADVIVNGYAFTKEKNMIRVLNLNNPTHASVLALSGEVIETSMDDIEIQIILDYYRKNSKYMGDTYA